MTRRARFLMAVAAAALLAALPTTAQANSVSHGKWGGQIEFRVSQSDGHQVVHFMHDLAHFGHAIVHHHEFQSCRFIAVAQTRCVHGAFTSATTAEGDFWAGTEVPRLGEHRDGHVIGEWKAHFLR